MFVGEDLDHDACEVLLHTRWTQRDRKAEPGLFAYKWFDHRQDHPTKATYLFGHLFTQEVRRVIRAHIDCTPPGVDPITGRTIDWDPIKSGDILCPPTGSAQRVKYWHRKITSLIRARQAADRAGIPYEVFVRLGIKHWYFGRSYIFDHQTLPEPGLLNGAECYNDILRGWMDIVRGQIQYAKSDRFKVTVGSKHPDVVDHIMWLLDQISRKPDPKYAIRKFVAMNLLPEDAAIARFGTSWVMSDIRLTS